MGDESTVPGSRSVRRIVGCPTFCAETPVWAGPELLRPASKPKRGQSQPVATGRPADPDGGGLPPPLGAAFCPPPLHPAATTSRDARTARRTTTGFIVP